MRNLVKNKSINSDISSYWNLYLTNGEVSFELSETEYGALAQITKEYHEASTAPDFDGVTWAKQAGEQGLFQHEKSAYVFNLLMLTWHTQVSVSVSREAPWVIFTARRITGQAPHENPHKEQQ